MWEEFAMGLICIYFLIIICLLGFSVPWQICVVSKDNNECCCMVWFTLLFIGIPSSFVWFHILVFKRWPNQYLMWAWLLPTCILGNVSMLHCKCENVWLRIPTAALVLQNNILLLAPLIVCVVCALKHRHYHEEEEEEHHHQQHVYRIMEVSTQDEEDDSDWQRV